MPAKSVPKSSKVALLSTLPTHTEAPLITKDELARDLRVSRRTIEAWIAQRRIPFVRLGHRTLRFSLDDVRRALRLHWTVREVS